MRFEFTDQGERAQLARQLGLPTHHVTDDVLARAVADRLQRRPERDPGDMTDLDAIANDSDRRRLKRERYERLVAAQRRREHVPSDADDRVIGYEDDPNWFGDSRGYDDAVEQTRGSVIQAFTPPPRRQPAPKPQRQRVHFGQRYKSDV